MVALGAVEAIMTVTDGCFASVVVDGEPTLYRVRNEPRETVATVGAGDAFLVAPVEEHADLLAEFLRGELGLDRDAHGTRGRVGGGAAQQDQA